MRAERGLAQINGADIFWELHGEGPPIVFIHGFTLDHRMWEPQIDAFAATHTVLTWDMRGFGKSSIPDEDRPYWHDRDLAALMDHLELGRADIVGLSYGGWVAIEFALTHPHLVRSLVLVDATIRHFPYGTRWQGVLDELYRLAQAGRMDEGKDLWLSDIVFTCPGRSALNTSLLRTMVGDYPGWHLTHTDPHPLLEPRAMDRLPELAAPILAITGELDIREFQDIADFVVAHAANARRVVMPNAGHMANIDDPEAFNRIVREFIESV